MYMADILLSQGVGGCDVGRNCSYNNLLCKQGTEPGWQHENTAQTIHQIN